MSLTKFAGAIVLICSASAVYAQERVINIFPEDKTKEVVVPVNELKVSPKSDDDSNFLWGLFSSDEITEKIVLQNDGNSQEVKTVENTNDTFDGEIKTSDEAGDETHTIIKSKIRMLPQYSYFDHKNIEDMSDRMYIDQETLKINFLAKKGYLKSSVKALMKETINTKSLVWRVGSHRVFGDYWVQGDSMEEVFNNLLKPYLKPNQVMGGTFMGNSIGVFYSNDQEFSQ